MMFQGILPGSDPNAPNAFIQTPDQIARARALADALTREGSNYSPVQSPWQGAARLAQALSGAIGNYQADKSQRLSTADAAADQSNVLNRNGVPNDPGEQIIPATPGQTTPALAANDAANDAITDAPDTGANLRAALVAALGGGSPPAASSGNPVLAAALGTPPQPRGDPSSLAAAAGMGAGTPFGTANVGGGDMAPYQAAIAKIESGGNYGAVGPVTGHGDRAYGKYQVMGANIPQWTQAAPGRSMTPQEFLANPQAQDAVFNHQFGGYVQKYGPQNAASMWLTGRTLGNGGAGAADQLGTTGQGYADRFTRNLGAAPASAAIGGATGAHVPTWAEVQADNAAGTNAINAATAAGNGALLGASSHAPGAIDRLSPAATASPLARPAVPPSPTPTAGDFGQLRTAMAAQPTPSLNATISGHPVEAPAKAISPSPFSPAPNPMQGDIGGLLRVASNPWTSPAGQQVASGLLQNQMPQRPSIIEGPTDPDTGYATKLVWSPTQGVLGRLNADGSVSPVGQAGGTGGGNAGTASNSPKPPPGTDAKTWREELARRGAALVTPSTDEVKGITTSARSDPAYQEADVATATYNSMLNEAKYNNHASDKALIDAFAKINNPGRAVGVGQYTINADIQSLPDTIRGEVAKAYNGGGVLQPETRAAIIQLARQRVDEYQKSWDNARAPFLATAKRGNIPDFAVPDIVKPNDPNWGDIGRYSVDQEGVHDGKNGGALVDPRTLQPIKGASPQPAAQAGPSPPVTGARLAPDGNWYAPDPARPGKYLLVH